MSKKSLSKLFGEGVVYSAKGSYKASKKSYEYAKKKNQERIANMRAKRFEKARTVKAIISSNMSQDMKNREVHKLTDKKPRFNFLRRKKGGCN